MIDFIFQVNYDMFINRVHGLFYQEMCIEVKLLYINNILITHVLSINLNEKI